MDGFDAINAELYQCGYRAQFASALVNPSTRFVNNVAYVLVGVFGILAVLKNALTPGGVASFLTYTAQFSKPFNEITAITMQLQLAMASARRVFAVLDGEEQRPESADAARLEAAEGSVAFEHVRFAYQPERPLITDFNLTVKPGMTVAIVGPTGAGKTTLVNLLMRFYEVDDGRIKVEGQDITGVTRDSLRRSFGRCCRTPGCLPAPSGKTSPMASRTPPTRKSKRRPGPPMRTVSSAGCPTATAP